MQIRLVPLAQDLQDRGEVRHGMVKTGSEKAPPHPYQAGKIGGIRKACAQVYELMLLEDTPITIGEIFVFWNNHLVMSWCLIPFNLGKP